MSFSTDNHGKINSQTLKTDKRKLDEDDDDEFLFVKWLTDKRPYSVSVSCGFGHIY